MLIVLCLLTSYTQAQTFEVPTDINLTEAADYARYEEDVVACANWLLATPLEAESQKRREANAFMLKWLMGSPNVTIELNPNIITFTDSSPELLIIFMAGWANYVLTTSEFNNKLKGNMAGLEFVLQFYEANRTTLNDKNVDRFIKLRKKGKLKSYLKKHI